MVEITCLYEWYRRKIQFGDPAREFIENFQILELIEKEKPGTIAVELQTALEGANSLYNVAWELECLEVAGKLECVKGRMIPPPPLREGRLTFTAYRGIGSLNETKGIAWSLSLATAKYYADHYPREATESCVVSAPISPSDIMTFRERRKSEFYLWPTARWKLKARVRSD